MPCWPHPGFEPTPLTAINDQVWVDRSNHWATTPCVNTRVKKLLLLLKTTVQVKIRIKFKIFVWNLGLKFRIFVWKLGSQFWILFAPKIACDSQIKGFFRDFTENSLFYPILTLFKGKIDFFPLFLAKIDIFSPDFGQL